MRKHTVSGITASAVASWLSLSTPVYAAPATAPEVFGALPQTTDVSISPDGKMLAWGDNSADDPKIVILDVAAGAILRKVNLGEGAKLRSLQWSDDQVLLVTASMSMFQFGSARLKMEFYRTMALNVASGLLYVMLRDAGKDGLVSGTNIVAAHTSEPHTIMMSSFGYDAMRQRGQTGTLMDVSKDRSAFSLDLYAVNSLTGEGKLAELGTAYTTEWIVDGDGTAVAYTEWFADRKHFAINVRSGKEWRDILHRDGEEAPTVCGLEQGGGNLIVLGHLGGPYRQIWRQPLSDAPASVLVAAPGADIDSCNFNAHTGVLESAAVSGTERDSIWVDEDARQRAEKLHRTFSGKTVTRIDESSDHRQVVALVEDQAAPPVYYLVNFNTNRAAIIGAEYPALKGQPLGEVRDYRYKARDGVDIPAYLTLPVGVRDAKALPTIVMPHGGPSAHDSPGFDWLRQFLASLGYMVLQPQFRGSTGYGVAFREAGRKQWGGLMQDDVTDGVLALVRDGLADPHRICIVGASYGGYAALAGAAFTPDLYACAASINGVSDLPHMYEFIVDQSGSASDRPGYWRDDIGSPNDRTVIARSPARSAATVRAPILLIHSVDDSRVPMQQSAYMAAALKRAGKVFAFAKLPGDDHWLSRAVTRKEMLHQLQDFLHKYLPAN